MSRSIMVERISLNDMGTVRSTKEGYIVAAPRVARTGIQTYTGAEVGVADKQVVRVYRPESEVFASDAFRSLAHRPITDDHPRELVSVDNWKKFAVGQADGEVVRDGEFIRVPMMLMDKAAIDKFRAGKAELSVGYTCDLKWEPGFDPESGLAYDAVQTNIRANHIALVDAARGGPKLRIGDDGSLVADVNDQRDKPQKEKTTMSDIKATKALVVDGITCVMDEQAAQIVQRALDNAAKEVSKANETIAKLTADAKKKDEDILSEEEKKKKELEAKDAEIAALKKKVEDSAMTPEKLAALVKDRAEVIGKAKAVLGDKAPKDIEAMDSDAVRKAVVEHKLGDASKGWDANAINVAFTTLTADVKADDAAGKGVQQMASMFSQQKPMGDGAPSSKAYDAYKKRISDGWKQPAAS